MLATFAPPSDHVATYAFKTERTARVARVLWARDIVAELSAEGAAARDIVNPFRRIERTRELAEELRTAKRELLSAEISLLPGDHTYL